MRIPEIHAAFDVPGRLESMIATPRVLRRGLEVNQGMNSYLPYIMANYGDLSRRVTSPPKGGDCRGISPKILLDSGLGIIVICQDTYTPAK